MLSKVITTETYTSLYVNKFYPSINMAFLLMMTYRYVNRYELFFSELGNWVIDVLSPVEVTSPVKLFVRYLPPLFIGMYQTNTQVKENLLFTAGNRTELDRAETPQLFSDCISRSYVRS